MTNITRNEVLLKHLFLCIPWPCSLQTKLLEDIESVLESVSVTFSSSLMPQ